MPINAPRMLAAVDTNVVVSGLLWGGAPRELLRLAAEGHLTLVTSEELLAELGDVLRRPKFAARLCAIGASPESLIAEFRCFAIIIDAPPLAKPVVEADPDDDMVLACALVAKADRIVSGDQHLLALGEFEGIPIVPPKALLLALSQGE